MVNHAPLYSEVFEKERPKPAPVSPLNLRLDSSLSARWFTVE